MSRILAAIFTMALMFTVAPAHAAVTDTRIAGPVVVDRATYHAATQGLLNKCGTGRPADSAYVPPAAPQIVVDAVKADKVAGFVKYLDGTRTGNGLPSNGFRSERKVIGYLALPSGARVQTQKYAYERHAWVPGFNGQSCKTWTKLVYRP